jgi:hypothetical protein
MSLPEIRPLSFGETLDRSFALYRSHFPVLATICLVPGLVVMFSNVSLRLLSEATPQSAVKSSYLTVIPTILLIFIYLFLQFLTMAACVLAVAEIYLGRNVTVAAAYGKMLQSVWQMLGLLINICIRMLLCIATIILIPMALLLMLWYAFAIPASLVERLSSGKALTRSRDLTEGMRGQIFLTFVLMLILTYIVTLVLQMPIGFLTVKIVREQHAIPMWLTVFAGLMNAVAGALTTPPLMVALTLLYFNTRVVREGYDLELMLERLGSGIAADVAGPVNAPLATPESTNTA